MAALQRTDAAAEIPSGEVYGPICDYEGLPCQKISYGLPFDEAVLKHVAADARVFVIASRTLCSKTDSLERLKTALGARFRGVRVGMTPHTIYQECLEVRDEAVRAQADTIVTLGAGSLADAAKFVCCASANTFATVEDLAFHEVNRDEANGGKIRFPPTKPNDMNLVMIPTSLSAGEHTPYAGITDRDTKRKYQIRAGGASVTILDPWLCLHTPNSIWLQSGVRGIDHGVEHGCGSATRPECVELCKRGLQLLVPGLLACAREDTEYHDAVKARLNAQLGVAMTVTPLLWNCHAGASHGIGHMLGPMGGIGHGETSCILLPAVCRYNASANGAEQAAMAAALWEGQKGGNRECVDLFERNGLDRSSATLPDLLDAVIRALGMPRSLHEKGIQGDDALNRLAELSLHDFFLHTNPVPISEHAEVMKILRAVEG